METEFQSTCTRLCSSLQLVLRSQAVPPGLPNLCQQAFPGVCYLSFALLTDEDKFAVTGNLVHHTQPGVSMIASQESIVGPLGAGVLLHSFGPRQYPDLASLQQQGHWDSVLALPCPCPASNMLTHTDTASSDESSLIQDHSLSQDLCRSAQQPRGSANENLRHAIGDPSASPQSNANGADSATMSGAHQHAQAHGQQACDPVDALQVGHTGDRAVPTSEATGGAAWQAGASANSAAVVILGLRGHKLDLERTLSNLQLLANEMTPFLQHNQQHILEQAARANAAAPQSATTPFADAGSEDYVNASSSLEYRQERRREDSGSLPLDQILSRRPSPSNVIASQQSMEAASEGLTTPRYSMTATRFSSSSLQGSWRFSVPGDLPGSTVAESRRDSYPGRSVSRLRASSLPSELAHGLIEALAENPEHAIPSHETQDSSFVNSGTVDHTHGDTADSGIWPLQLHQQLLAEPQPKAQTVKYGLQTVISGQGLALPADADQHDSSTPAELSSEASRRVSSNVEGDSLQAGTALGFAGSVADVATEGSFPQELEAAAGAAQADDAELAADMDLAKRKHKLRQHPWLLYFHDRASEADYAKYHASQMLKVDTISMIISAIIYINLGFSSSHNFARRIPVTFCLTLGMHLAFIYLMNFQSRMFASRFTQIREVLIRGLVLYYIAAQVFVNTPNALLSGKVPIHVMHQPAWLARYSNTSPLLTTTFGFMVRLHVHLPCQIINFAMSAAYLPRAICQAGYADCNIWKCVTVGVMCQFMLGLVLSTAIVLVNERRLRGMYIKKQLVDSRKKQS